MWTVGGVEEIKLRFKISPAQGGNCLKVVFVITVLLVSLAAVLVSSRNAPLGGALHDEIKTAARETSVVLKMTDVFETCL